MVEAGMAPIAHATLAKPRPEPSLLPSAFQLTGPSVLDVQGSTMREGPLATAVGLTHLVH